MIIISLKSYQIPNIAHTNLCTVELTTLFTVISIRRMGNIIPALFYIVSHEENQYHYHGVQIQQEQTPWHVRQNVSKQFSIEV